MIVYQEMSDQHLIWVWDELKGAAMWWRRDHSADSYYPYETSSFTPSTIETRSRVVRIETPAQFYPEWMRIPEGL